MPSAGMYFAQVFEKHCLDAVAKKLADTPALKKMMVGIVTVQDAQAKGYAPSDAHIAAIAACIRDAADAAYGLAFFCEQPAEVAAAQLVQAIAAPIHQMNEKWREARQFHFDAPDLADIMAEAQAMVAQAHGQFVTARA